MDAMQVYVNVSICVYVVYCRVAIENELLCSILLERISPSILHNWMSSLPDFMSLSALSQNVLFKPSSL
jgi:hypothetical protein